MAFAVGKWANALCDRCGFKFKYNQLREEAGTHLRVCCDCNDGMWNIVDHPQNKPPLKLTDAVGLKNPRPQPDPVTDEAIFGQENAGDIVDYVNLYLLTP